VIEKTFDVALDEARAEGYAAAMRELQNRTLRANNARRPTVISQMMRVIPLARRTA